MVDQVDEVKQKTDIVALIGSYIPIKKAGRNYKANCPFHGEKTPSFMVSPELQIYKCFGCGASGDALSFLEKYDGMEFGEALKFLADKAGIKLISQGFSDRGEKDVLFEINTLTAKFYNYILLNHASGKKALDYLMRQRGIKQETINKLQLGYAPSASRPIVDFLTKKKKFNPKDLVNGGTFYQGRSGLVDRFEGRVVFPIFDHRGNTVGFTGRLLPDDPRKEVGKYVNSPESPVYHKSSVLYGLNFAKEEIKSKKEAVLVEGQMDFVSTFQAGIRNVVAIAGTALTKEQVDLLIRFAPKIILSLDADSAGDIAARRGIVVAQEKGMNIKVASLGDFKDPDEMVRKNPQGFVKALEKAVEVWDFYISSTFSKYDSSSGEGKSKISKEIVPILASIPDRIVQSHYISLVAEKLGVPVAAVFEEVSGETGVDKKDTPVGLEPEKVTRRQLLEESLLAILFQTDPAKVVKTNCQRYLSTHILKRIVEEYKGYVDKTGKNDISSFSATLPKELLDKFSEIVLTDLGGLEEDEEKLGKEVDNVKLEIELLEVRERKLTLTKEIEVLEKGDNEDKIRQAQEEYDQLSKKKVELEERKDRGIIL